MLANEKREIGLAGGPGSGSNTAMDFKAANQSIPPVIQPASGPAEDFERLLLAVGRKKDKEAFAALFDYFAPRIKSFLMKGGASPDVAEEMAQETMLAIWQKADGFDPSRASASTWIFTIARNKRIDALRKQKRPEFDPQDPLLIADGAPGAGEEMDRRTETDVMASALQDLPPEQADLLYKSFFEEKTHADIAKETNLPLGTVKSRIRIALEKLRAQKKVKSLWT